MITLYEIQTGWIGEAYERAYVWAESEQQARELFEATEPEHPARHVIPLFQADAKPFITKLSDSGWER